MKGLPLQRLNRLHDMFRGKHKYILEMTDIFLAQMPETLVKIEQYIRDRNRAGICYEAHTIKSSINIINLNVLKPIITQLENCEQEDWATIEQTYKLFQQKVQEEIMLIQEDRKILINSIRGINATT